MNQKLMDKTMELLNVENGKLMNAIQKGNSTVRIKGYSGV